MKHTDYLRSASITFDGIIKLAEIKQQIEFFFIEKLKRLSAYI